MLIICSTVFRAVIILHSRVTYTVITFVDLYVNVVLLAGFVFQCEKVYKLDQTARNCSSDPPALSCVKGIMAPLTVCNGFA